MENEEKRGRGRPSDYKEEYAEQAYDYCLLNAATNDDLASYFGVSKTTIKTWMKEHPEFLTSVKEGKIGADAKVAKSLYQRAIGSEWEEEQAIKIKVDQFTEEVQIVKVKRVAPPDPTSIQFWLKNRQPDKWREKKDINAELSGGLEITFDLGNLSESQADKDGVSNTEGA